MNIITWIVLGLITGALLGTVGAFIGGTLTTLLITGNLGLTTSTLLLSSILISIAGAIIAVFIRHQTAERSI